MESLSGSGGPYKYGDKAHASTETISGKSSLTHSQDGLVSVSLPVDVHTQEVAVYRMYNQSVEEIAHGHRGMLSALRDNGLTKTLMSPFKRVGNFLKEQAVDKGIGTEREVRTQPANKLGLTSREDAREIRFGLKDGPLLEGIIFGFNGPPDLQQKTILLCTGSGGPSEAYAIPMVEAFRDMGHRVMTFNYEGFGQSEGTRSEQGVYKSVEAAYQFLRQVEECDDQSIVCWGYSLGSGAATHLATEHEVDIVLDRGVTSISSVAAQEAPLGFKTLTKTIFKSAAHFDNLSKLPDVRGRVLIAQESENSPMGERLEEAIRNSNKEVVYLKDVTPEHMHTQDVWFSEKKQGTDPANMDALDNFIKGS